MMSPDDDDKYDLEHDGGLADDQRVPSTKKANNSQAPTNATRMRRRRQRTPAIAESQNSNDFGDTFGLEAAEQAKGNFLITIGFPGSGKSTFHSFLFRMCEEIHQVKPLSASGDPPGVISPIMESRLNAWRRRYHLREQVDRTDQGEANIYEIAFKVTPKTRPNHPLDLRVIEVSGEDLRRLDNSATGKSVAEIPQAIGALLDDDKLNERNVIVAFMVDPDPEADPIEFLVDGLLSYMQVHGPKRISKTKFCLILPKPLKILESLREFKEQYPDLWEKYPKRPTLEAYKSAKDVDGSLASFYLAVFKKNAVQRLRAVAPKGGLMRSQFYLGEIEQQFIIDGDEEVPVEVLTTVSFRDSAAVFQYIYEAFTNKKLKPGILDKLKGR